MTEQESWREMGVVGERGIEQASATPQAKATAMDKDRLTKLMMMTTSDKDNEALTALRIANAMLKAEGICWAELLATCRLRLDFATVHRGHDEIGEMLDVVMEGAVTEAQRTFASGVRQFWEERGYLTEKQFEALRKTAERYGGR